MVIFMAFFSQIDRCAQPAVTSSKCCECVPQVPEESCKSKEPYSNISKTMAGALPPSPFLVHPSLSPSFSLVMSKK